MGLAEAKKKYANKVRVMGPNYIAGVSAFLGVDVSRSVPVANYNMKIKSGVEDKWERNYKAAFGV